MKKIIEKLLEKMQELELAEYHMWKEGFYEGLIMAGKSISYVEKLDDRLYKELGF